MNFVLDPPSGHADSYFDIEFKVTFGKCEKAIVKFFNMSSQEQLEIIGVTQGYIQNADEAVVHNSSSIKGHINIFNDDKMNNRFTTYGNVAIRCDVEMFDENNNKSEDSVVLEFYNESQSLDANIIPFDFILPSNKIDIVDNEPIAVEIISGSPKKYEISLRSNDGTLECNMEVFCREGKTSVHIPAEFVYYDLELNKNKKKKFQFYYVKVHGTSFSRLANKRYILIENSQIEFNIPEALTPKPQKRESPTGRRLDKSFVISDRYLVLCPEKYSGLAARSKIDEKVLMDTSMLVHEAQNMKSINRQVSQFSATEDDVSAKIADTQKTIHDQKVSAQTKVSRPKISLNQFRLLKSLSGNYNEISKRSISSNNARPMETQEVSATTDARVFSESKDHSKVRKPGGGGCAPCARKRQNA